MVHGLPAAASEKLMTVLRDDSRIEKAWLYGSRALGRERPESDIDLCLEGQTLQLADLYAIESRIDDLLLPWEVDLSLMHKIDSPALLEHIKRVGTDLLAS